MYSVYPVEYKKERKSQMPNKIAACGTGFMSSKKWFSATIPEAALFMEKQDEEKLWKLQRI